MSIAFVVVSGLLLRVAPEFLMEVIDNGSPKGATVEAETLPHRRFGTILTGIFPRRLVAE